MLFISIILSFILIVILMLIETGIGFLIVSAIALGCIMRGLYILSDIRKKLTELLPDESNAEAAYDRYLEERDKR